MLAGAIRKETLPANARALDLCTGSGYLAIVAAQQGAREVFAIDVSRRAVLAARLNGRLNGVAIQSRRGDLFEPIDGQSFDLIVSNPPYIPSIGDKLPARGLARAWEAGRDGRAILDRICDQAPKHLKPGGVVLLVHSSMCSEAATLDALAKQGLRSATVDRRRGRIGRVTHSRKDILAARGLLPEGEYEETIVVRAERPQ
jgi:release factor glutamine methyltransferase